MRKLKKGKLTPIEQKLLQELARSQDIKLGRPKHENLGFSDMPLFNPVVPELF